MGDDLFARAREAVAIKDLVERGGGKLVKAGHELRGVCPLCGAGASSGAFAVKPDRRTWRCYGCDRFGDVVDLEVALTGDSALEAARRLIGGGYEPVAVATPKVSAGPSSSQVTATEMWANAQPFAGSPAMRYLRERGIAQAVLDRVGDGLRYHPFAKWGWDDRARDWIKAPAMVAQVVTEAGPTGGVHATYLARGGLGNAALKPAKRMWGPQVDADGRPGGAWLIGPDSSPDLCGRLCVAEGIETVLSMASLLAPEPVRAAAALSLNRLQGGAARDEAGCVDVWNIRPDPKRPPFTWPRAGSGEVLIGVDRESSPIKVRARTGRGKPCEFTLDSEARARMCAVLAVHAWRAAGWEEVTAIAPPPLMDFNDVLVGRK